MAESVTKFLTKYCNASIGTWCFSLDVFIPKNILFECKNAYDQQNNAALEAALLQIRPLERLSSHLDIFTSFEKSPKDAQSGCTRQVDLKIICAVPKIVVDDCEASDRKSEKPWPVDLLDCIQNRLRCRYLRFSSALPANVLVVATEDGYGSIHHFSNAAILRKTDNTWHVDSYSLPVLSFDELFVLMTEAKSNSHVQERIEAFGRRGLSVPGAASARFVLRWLGSIFSQAHDASQRHSNQEAAPAPTPTAPESSP